MKYNLEIAIKTIRAEDGRLSLLFSTPDVGIFYVSHVIPIAPKRYRAVLMHRPHDEFVLLSEAAALKRVTDGASEFLAMFTAAMERAAVVEDGAQAENHESRETSDERPAPNE